jgi:tRNA(adenine34) deaminase
MLQIDRDERYMRAALEQAKTALSKDEVPVGAVFVLEDRIIARTHNQCEMLTDPTAHAELIGITQACEAVQAQRLTSVEVFVTKEPCAMCAGALVHARVSRLIIGTPDIKAGACGTKLQLVDHPELNHSISTLFGVLETECRELLQEFFRSKR